MIKHHHRPWVIGLIGSIASGKSSVAKAFEILGAELIDTDTLAKNLYLPGTPLYQKIKEHFGSSLLNPSLEINRERLKQIILDSASEKNWLEAQIHPAVRQLIQQAIHTCTALICVIEIPLLKNRTDYPELDYILWVRCQPEEQLKRLMKRNRLTEEDAKKLINLAIPATIQEKIADSVLDTTQLREQDLMDFTTHFVAEQLARRPT